MHISNIVSTCEAIEHCLTTDTRKVLQNVNISLITCIQVTV